MVSEDTNAIEPLLDSHGQPTVSAPTSPTETGLESTTSILRQNITQDVDAHRSRDDFRAELQDLKSNALLAAQGHEPTMRRTFSPFAAVVFGFRHVSGSLDPRNITNSWVGYLSCFGQNLAYAGPQNVVFGLLIAAMIQWVITLGLSEIASCFPCSGGQYHFVFILAPQRSKRFAAFVVGWMNILGWSVTLCSGVSVVVASIAGLIVFWDETFQATQWQLYLIYLAVAILSVPPLFLGPRLVPILVQASVTFSIIGFFVVFCLTVALRKYKQPMSFITTPHLGTSGWGLGSAWIMGVINAMYAFAGTDAVIHIAEEMSFPEKKLPQAINTTMVTGFMTAFPLLLVAMLSMADIDAVVSSQLPYAEMFYQITGSRAVTILIMCWITIIFFTCLIGQWVTCGRLTWAFARDNGLPYSTFFSHVSKRYGFPVRTTLLSLFFCCVYGLLYLLSTTAFNSIITSAVLFLNITYAIPQALVASRGRANVLPVHPFDLGYLGYACNLVSPILVIVIGVYVCLPSELPVTRHNINYTPAVIVSLFSGIIGIWFTAGRRFEGPKIDWDMLKNIKIT